MHLTRLQQLNKISNFHFTFELITQQTSPYQWSKSHQNFKLYIDDKISFECVGGKFRRKHIKSNQNNWSDFARSCTKGLRYEIGFSFVSNLKQLQRKLDAKPDNTRAIQSICIERRIIASQLRTSTFPLRSLKFPFLLLPWIFIFCIHTFSHAYTWRFLDLHQRTLSGRSYRSVNFKARARSKQKALQSGCVLLFNSKDQRKDAKR